MTDSAQKQMEHYLDILEVDSKHSWEDIEKQYRQLIQRWHPDRNLGDDSDDAQTKFIEVNTAYKLVRAHYRKNGSIPRRMPPEQKGPLLGTRKQTQPQPAFYKNKAVVAGVLGFTIVAMFGAILWSLDSRLAENNRDRADAEKIEASMKSSLPTANETVGNDQLIKQSTMDVEP